MMMMMIKNKPQYVKKGYKNADARYYFCSHNNVAASQLRQKLNIFHVMERRYFDIVT